MPKGHLLWFMVIIGYQCYMPNGIFENCNTAKPGSSPGFAICDVTIILLPFLFKPQHRGGSFRFFVYFRSDGHNLCLVIDLHTARFM